MGPRALGIVVAVILLAGTAAVAAASPRRLKPEARVHLDRGLKLYNGGRYDDAIIELRAGLAVDPQPDLLYALGQAERRRGNCARAVEYYQSALALVKDPAATAALRVQIERCHVETDEQRPPSPAAETKDATPKDGPPKEWTEPKDWNTPKESAEMPGADEPDAAAPPAAAASLTRAPAHPWYRDPAGLSLAAIGVAAIATGGALVGVATTRLDAAGDSYQQYADARGAQAMWTGGVIALAGGGALLLGGIIRFSVVAARRSHGEGR